MRVAHDFATYSRMALREHGVRTWELIEGELREKPGGSFVENRCISALMRQLFRQLPDGWTVESNSTALQAGERTFVVPDLLVMKERLQTVGSPSEDVEAYYVPMQFVADAWASGAPRASLPSRVLAYRSRGDIEIWRMFLDFAEDQARRRR